MSKAGEIPYSWSMIEAQILDAILAQASILRLSGPHSEALVCEYLGITEELDWEDLSETKMGIDISRHNLYNIVKLSYNYAYQLDGAQFASGEQLHEVDGLLQGFPQADAAGEPSPFSKMDDPPLRRVLETFFARYALYEEGAVPDYGLSIRELALLANMTVPAVRTALSKEGLKLEKKPGTSRESQDEGGFRLPRDDAKRWLSRRRGFIPQRIDIHDIRKHQIINWMLSDRDMDFPAALTQLIQLRGIDPPHVAELAGVEQVWLAGLMARASVALDLSSLRAVARVLDVPEPDFVALGVRYILAKEVATGQ